MDSDAWTQIEDWLRLVVTNEIQPIEDTRDSVEYATLKFDHVTVEYSFDTCAPCMTSVKIFKGGHKFTEYIQFRSRIRVENLSRIVRDLRRDSIDRTMCDECQCYDHLIRDNDRAYCEQCYPHIVTKGTYGECPLCHTDDEGRWTMLRCEHTFHYRCIKKVSVNQTCPLCHLPCTVCDDFI